MISLRPRAWRDLFPADLAVSADDAWITLPAAPPDSSELWGQLAHATDSRHEHPQARPGVAVEQLAGDKGAILSYDEQGIYMHLAPEDLFLWGRMDGTRTQINLVVDYCLQYKALAPARVAALVESLRAESLLVEPPDELYPKLIKRLVDATPMGRINKIVQTFLQREFAIGGIDAVVGRAYRAFGWLIYTWPAQVVLWLIAALGVGAFLWLLRGGKFSILGEGTVVEGALTLFVFQVLSLLLHEMSHAFTVKAFGRRVRRAGLLLLYGMPGAFVDTTDIWPAGKRAQLAVTWAGPLSNLVLGGITSLLIITNPDAAWSPLAFQFAISQYTLVVLNLTPFIRLDGYYLLSDGLGIPNLRTRAAGFLRNGLPAKMRRAWSEGRLLPPLNREEKILIIFGVLSMLWVLNLMGLAVITAPVRLARIAQSLIQNGVTGRSPLVIFFMLTGTLLTTLLLIRSVSTLRQSLQTLARSLERAPAWRVALVFAALALLVAAIPDLIASQAPTATKVYAYGIALAAGALATLYAARLSRELRGSHLRPALMGLLLGALALTAATALAALNVLPLAALPFAHLLALLPSLMGALVTAPRLWPLRVAALGWAALMGLLAAGSLVVAASPSATGHFFTSAGCTLLAAALLVHWQLAQRPLALPRVPTQLDTSDPALMLKKAVAAVARELAQAFSEVAGRQAMLALAYNFNNRAADADWPLWLTMKGQLGEKFKGTAEQRAPIYRAALADLRDQIADKLGTAFADDAQAQALAELPPPMRFVFQRWIIAGGETAADDDRVRLRLAGRRLAETLVIGCARVYGWLLTEEPIGNFNRAAAVADWPLYVRGNGRMADDLRGDLLGTAQVYADALQDLLSRVAAIAGVAFVERGVMQVFDSLPWETREVASTLLFDRLSWARRLHKTRANDSRAAFLHSVPLLGWLTPDDLTALAAQLTPRAVKAGRTAIALDAYLDHALIVRHGNLQAVASAGGVRRVVEQVSPGGIIGVRSIVDHQPIPYEYVTQTDVELWRIPSAFVAERLHPLLHLQDALDEQRATLALLARIPLFATLDTTQRLKLAKALEAQRLPPGTVVLQEGAEGQGFFIVRTGELEVIAGERRVSTLGPGEFFGETALLKRTPITATVRTRTDCDVLRLPPAEFYALLSGGLAATLDQVQSRRAKERMRLSQTVVAEGAA